MYKNDRFYLKSKNQYNFQRNQKLEQKYHCCVEQPGQIDAKLVGFIS